MEVAQGTEKEEAAAAAATGGEEGEEAGSEAAAVMVVEAAETARAIPGALPMTSPSAFALWGGRFSAVLCGFLIRQRSGRGNYNSRQASGPFVASLRRASARVISAT